MTASALERVRRRARRLVRRSPLYVRHRSLATHVFHCALPRTGSQWIRGMLRDERVYRYSGLGYYDYLTRFANDHDPRKLTERTDNEPFPEKRIASPLYFSFESFRSIPKAGPYRAFFVCRDPRDLVVSWYFSMRESHKLKGQVSKWRAQLKQLPMQEGLRYSLHAMEEDVDIFGSMRSWIGASEVDPAVRVVRYEDLIGPTSREVFGRLFDHLDIQLPARILSDLVTDHSFARKTGRRTGQEDRGSQMRKGVAGDWRNHLDGALLEEVEALTGDLIESYGYSRSGERDDG